MNIPVRNFKLFNDFAVCYLIDKLFLKISGQFFDKLSKTKEQKSQFMSRDPLSFLLLHQFCYFEANSPPQDKKMATTHTRQF